MNLNPRVSNLNPTITGMSLGGHAFNSMAIPISTKNGVIEKNFLIDATFRQFFLRDNFSINGRFIKDKRFGGKVSPMAGYFCINLPGGKEFANIMLKRGFTELTPENAKLYGDSFILELQENEKYRKLYAKGITVPVPKKKNLITGISGYEYIERFTDLSKQDYRGIDFEEGELEKCYGKLMKTPLMLKETKNEEMNKQEELLNDRIKQKKDMDSR